MSVKPVNNLDADTASPCVRNCCLDELDVCLGCNRHIDEIMAWRQLDNQAKQAVLMLCQQRQQQKNEVDITKDDY